MNSTTVNDNYIKNYKAKDSGYFSHTRPELLPFIDFEITKVLDIGCGNGSFGSMLKSKFGCTVFGIEPDKTSALQASEVLDKAINACFDENIVGLEEQQFDCIFFNDVLEHLTNPEEALALCKRYLKPSGKIIASIPNIRWYPVILALLRYKDFKYQDAGVMDKTHLRFFTEKSMVRLFENSGYNVEKIEGINKHSFKVLNFIKFFTFNLFNDMSFPQFAIVASPK